MAAFFLFSARGLTRDPAGRATAAPGRTLPDRSLASAPPPPIRATAGADHGLQVFRVECLFAAPPGAITTDAKMVRITSSFCGEVKALPRGAVFTGRNQSSGEDIVPFVQGGQAVLTSYFSLREGRNEISFRLALGKGKELRQSVVFVRAARPAE